MIWNSNAALEGRGVFVSFSPIRSTYLNAFHISIEKSTLPSKRLNSDIHRRVHIFLPLTAWIAVDSLLLIKWLMKLDITHTDAVPNNNICHSLTFRFWYYYSEACHYVIFILLIAFFLIDKLLSQEVFFIISFISFLFYFFLCLFDIKLASNEILLAFFTVL